MDIVNFSLCISLENPLISIYDFLYVKLEHKKIVLYLWMLIGFLLPI